MAAPEICPHCGSAVPPKAKSCPECGSDEETGWSEQATLDRLGVSSEEFDYDQFIKDEFGASSSSSSSSSSSDLRPKGIGWFWWIIAVLLLIAFFAVYF